MTLQLVVTLYKMTYGKHHLHVQISTALFYKWKNKRDLWEKGKVSERIRVLIENDAELTKEDMEKKDIENAVKELEKKQDEIAAEMVAYKAELRELENKEKLLEEEEYKRKLKIKKEKARLLKEILANGGEL